MVGSMRSGDSPSASGNNGGLGGPNSNNSGNSNSSSSKGNSPSSSGNNGGLGGPTSNNSGNSSKSSPSKGGSPSSSGTNGGLGGPTSNNSGNRSSPGSSPGGSGGNSNANGGGMGGQVGGGLNSAGNRASGAGPGASSNRSTTGGGYGSGSSLGGGMVSDAARRADMAQAARASENASMSTYNAARSLSQENARRADLAQQARTAETTSMRDLSRERALGTISTAEVGVKDPYNTLSGGLTADVTNMSVRDAIAFAKTSWQGKLANVVGAYQVKDTTLQAVATKLGLMDAKMTPAVQDRIAVGLMQERANKATVNGQVDVDKFAKELAKEWASIATTTGQSYYNANGIDKASISYAKARDIAKDLVANGVVSPNKSVGSITSKDVSSVQTQAPGLGRFNSTYMGSKTMAPKSAATSQQNDPSGLPAGTYSGHVVGNGLAPSFAAPTKQTAAAPTPTPAPERPRSITEKVAAGAIDVGLGMLPGVGMGVSLANGGLALTGNKTLGEQIAGSIATGEGAGTGPDSGANRTGGGNYRIVDKKKSTVPEKEESFESRYLAFVDPTPRPTPGQRWDYNTPGYA